MNLKLKIAVTNNRILKQQAPMPFVFSESLLQIRLVNMTSIIDTVP